jgi:hypothetical protein
MSLAKSPVTVGLMRAIVAVPFLIVAVIRAAISCDRKVSFGLRILQGLGIGLGILMMAGCAAVTMFSILLLVHTRDRTGLGSYEEVTFALFGRGAGLFLECNIIAFCCGSGIAYAKTLRDFLSPMIELAAVSPPLSCEHYLISLSLPRCSSRRHPRRNLCQTHIWSIKLCLLSGSW